jgi:hypothetical protein
LELFDDRNNREFIMVMTNRIILAALLLMGVGAQAGEQPARCKGLFGGLGSWFSRKPAQPEALTTERAARRALEYRYKTNPKLRDTSIPKLKVETYESVYKPRHHFADAPKGKIRSPGYSWPTETTEEALEAYLSKVPSLEGEQVQVPELRELDDELDKIKVLELGIEQKALRKAMDDLEDTENNILNASVSMEEALGDVYETLGKCYHGDKRWDTYCIYSPYLAKTMRKHWGQIQDTTKPVAEQAAIARKTLENRLSKIDTDVENLKWRKMYSKYQLQEADKEFQEGLQRRMAEDRKWQEFNLRQELGE